MNLNPAKSHIQRSGRPDLGLRRLSLPGPRLVVAAGHRLDFQRRLAETAERLQRGHSCNHLHDATANAITTANHWHRG
jgi:hypothetical protein